MKSIKFKLSQEPVKKRPPLETPKENRRRKKRKDPHHNTSPGISPEPVINQFSVDDGYHKYERQMLHSGILIVRNMSKAGGRLIMNDYETKRATIQVDRFVIVQYTFAPDELELECNCRDYKRTAGEGGTDLDPEGKWMGKANRCMHVRLLFQYMKESIKMIPNVAVDSDGYLSHLQDQLKQSCLTSANTEIVAVNSVNHLVVSVSLRDGDLPVFVKVHPETHNTTSFCKCSKRVIQNRPDYWLENRLKVDACRHIKVLTEHIQLLDQFLTQKRMKKTRTEKIEEFSKEKGTWISASLLQHKPKERGDPAYHR